MQSCNAETLTTNSFIVRMNRLILFSFFFFISVKSVAQADAYLGTWQMQYLLDSGKSPINMELQIGTSEKNILYPAQLKLQCDSFMAEYELLLVKKDARQLAISRNKYPVYEKPFSLGDCTFSLNGTFDHSRNLKGLPTLTIIRIPSKQNNTPDTAHLSKALKMTAIRLRDFLKDGEIKFKKINDSPWKSKDCKRILIPRLSPAYFGLLDTMFLQTKDGISNLISDKKNGNDIVSVAVNGGTIIDQVGLNKKEHEEDILLDTGLNYLVFFADNFGDDLPNRGRINLTFDYKKFSLDFADKKDSAATFIVTKLLFDDDKDNNRYFENYTSSEVGDKPLQPNEKLLGGIKTSSQQITLALWDDAVEDGDSVSIKINDKWLVQGFPVKNKTQFITVTLQPGPNTITFIADNLGSIPPNTSVLELIDGKKRKSFAIETTPEEKNYIKIYFDTRTD
jgi:hypothetical protein